MSEKENYEDKLFEIKDLLKQFNSYKEVLSWFPRSVWHINSRSKKIKEIFDDELVEKHTCKRTESGIPVSIQQNLSVFNPVLGCNILKIWSNCNDKVIDPFGGRDRAFITNFYNRNYTGYEISPDTYNKVSKKLETWKYRDDNYSIKLHNDDGTILKHEKENEYDFSYTCLPYWDKEKYESVPGQVSDIKTESEWRAAVKRCGTNLQRCLKPNKFCCIVVADIRRKGELIPLSSHIIEEFRSVGWAVKDIVVNKVNPINCSGINGFLRNMIMMKTHEYILVFKNTK